MGSYTDNLVKRQKARKKKPLGTERLIEAAIIRNDDCIAGAKSHAEIRAKLGDEEITVSKPQDREGFITSKARFVSRAEAVSVGVEAGQLDESWLDVRRPLLSSDIRW